MKRHKKVLFDQIKEEDQGKRKKRSSTIYYFATEAFLNILKIVLIIVGSLALSVTVSVIVTAINNGQAPNTAVLSSWIKLKGFFHLLFNLNNSKSGVMFLEHHPAAVCGADAPVEKAVKVDCRSFCQITRTVLTFFAG